MVYKFLCWLFLFFFFSCNTQEEIDLNHEIEYGKILMIGNSFTFYWNVPQVLEKMFEYNNIHYKVDQITIGGSTLKNHWLENKKKSYLIENYDIVVLNEYSTYALQNLDTCAKYLNLFVDLAKSKNVNPFVFGTWEYPYLKNISKDKTTNTMFRLDSLAKDYGATYVPVGNCFNAIERLEDSFDLYMYDKKHPSPNASYLIACVFYSMITGESPIGLPTRFKAKNEEGKKIYYTITEPKAALLAQQIANEFTEELR